MKTIAPPQRRQGHAPGRAPARGKHLLPEPVYLMCTGTQRRLFTDARRLISSACSLLSLYNFHVR
ncbi:MAG: hypothetical protein QOJ99_2827 [Bryobacterales bacterium]|jgi:hypothetical protein|nr:hypothetical protein [Bryobacterales bacterium]